jgi:hypothetical protein
MFGVTGAGLSKIRHMQNGGKRARHSIDQWDKQSMSSPPTLLSTRGDISQGGSIEHLLTSTVMDRDRRLTGFLRGQTDNAAAPAGFELNNPWRVCHSSSPITLSLARHQHSPLLPSDLRAEY